MLSARTQDARELNAARVINAVHRILKGFCTRSWYINNTVHRTPKGFCTQSYSCGPQQWEILVDNECPH